MLVRCLPASVQSARSVFEKNTHDLRAFHSTTDSTDLTDNLCLEGNTERSESNPGRSLGTTTKKKRAVWKTVPTQTEFTCSSLRDDHKCSKSITDNADATDMLFHGFVSSIMICLRLPGAMIVTDYLFMSRWAFSP